MRKYFPKRTSDAPLHTFSKLYDVPVGFVSPSFDALYCYICGRRRVAVAPYRMIYLVLAYVVLVETIPFPELVFFLDYSLRTSLGNFSILLRSLELWVFSCPVEVSISLHWCYIFKSFDWLRIMNMNHYALSLWIWAKIYNYSMKTCIKLRYMFPLFRWFWICWICYCQSTVRWSIYICPPTGSRDLGRGKFSLGCSRIFSIATEHRIRLGIQNRATKLVM